MNETMSVPPLTGDALVWMHAGLALLYMLFVLPLTTLIAHPPEIHTVFHGIGGVIISICVGFGIVAASRDGVSPTHGLAGILAYTGMLTVVLLGNSSSISSRIVKSRTLGTLHTLGARLFMGVAMPFQLLTGIIALLRLDDPILSGDTYTMRACVTTVAILGVGAGYAYMGRSVRPSTPMPQLFRAHTAFALEAIAITMLGISSVMYTAFFGTFAVPTYARNIGGAVTMCIGSGALTYIQRAARKAQHIPPLIYRGVHVLLALIVALLVSVTFVVRQTEYMTSAVALMGFIIVIIAVLRCTRALPAIPLFCGMLASVGFASQLGFERYFTAMVTSMHGSSRAVLGWWWLAFIVFGVIIGTITSACVAAPRSSHERVDESLPPRRRRRAPVPASDVEYEQLDHAVEEFIAESRRDD